MARQQVFLDDMDFELAKALAEGDVLRLGEALVAEAHDDVVVERPLDLAENRLVDRRRQIELDLCAAGRVRFAYRDTHEIYSAGAARPRPLAGVGTADINRRATQHKAPTPPQAGEGYD